MIFEYDRAVYPKAHMPYATMDCGLRQFGCVMVHGKWKIHELKDGVWTRIDTGLPEDATECSPFVSWDSETHIAGLVFIGGASAFSIPFRMYRCDDIDHPEWREITRAAVGYQWKQMTVHGDGSNEFDIDYEEGGRKHVRINGVEYIYRLTNDGTMPTRILASCQMDDGTTIRTFGIDPDGSCDELIADGHSVYKPCICDGQCAYAVKNGEGFEDRSIVSTRDWHYDIVGENPVEITDESTVEEE